MANLDLRPAHLPITVYYKGDVSMQFSFTSGGVLYPLTSVTAANFVISEKNGTTAINLSSGSGLTITAAAGTIDLAITHAQIVALATQEYNYEFYLTLSGGDVWPILDSFFNVSEDGQVSVTSSDVSVSLDGSNVDVSVVAPAVSGGGTWGSITGTLSDQTDLQSALDAKAATSHTHALSALTQSSATSGQIPKWSGTAWAAATDSNGVYSGSGTIPDGTAASLEAAGEFTINYANTGLPALWAIDNNNIQLRSPDGNVRIQVDNDQAEIESAVGFRLTINSSSGTAGQVPTAQGDGTTLWEDAAGGGASITDITYADMQTAITGGTLTEGAFYRITDAAGTDLGFVCQAIKTNEITVNGTGGYLNADFQAAGDYSGVEAVTGVVFMTPIGIWRTGFEAITIPYTNLSPDYIEYSTASGPLDDGETYTTDLGGTGTIIHDDGAIIVTLIPSGALVAGEIITGDNSGNTVTVDTYTHPVFAVGDTITGGNTGATAVIVTDDGASSMTAYMTSPGVAFDGSESMDNGDGVTADMDGAAGTPDIAQGDVVIWNLLHWQLTDATLLAGTDPATNTAAYTQLLKTDAGQGYITAWDVSEFDFVANEINYRQDLRGNSYKGSLFSFKWGDNNVVNNIVINGEVNIPNHAGQFIDNYIVLSGIEGLLGEINFGNNVLFGAVIEGIVNSAQYGQGFLTFQKNDLKNGASVSGITAKNDTTFENNILENGAQLTGITAGANCSISKNKLGSSAVFGGGIVLGDGASIDEMEFAANTGMSDVSLGAGTQMSGYVLFPNANVNTLTLGDGTASQNNILENGGIMTGITAGANCSISRNKIGQGATLGGSTTMGDGAQITDTTLANGYTLNVTLAAAEIIDGLNYGQITEIDEAARDGLIAPAAGLLILNTDTAKLNFYTGAGWEAVTSS